MLLEQLDNHDTKPNVIVASLRLEAQSKGGSAGPSLVCPASASSHSGRGHGRMQIWIDSSGQSGMIPVTAPFERVAMHVMQAPCIGGITADFRGPIERRPRFGSIVRLALEVRLFAAKRVAKRRG